MVCALDPDPCVGAQGGEGPSALEVPGARLERIVSRQAVEGRPARCQFARSELEQLHHVLRPLPEHAEHQPSHSREAVEHALERSRRVVAEEGLVRPCGAAGRDFWLLILASSSETKYQIFKYQNHAYGIQFHIEIKDTTVNEWGCVPEYKKALENQLGDGALKKFDRSAKENMTDMNNYSKTLYNNFKKLL